VSTHGIASERGPRPGIIRSLVRDAGSGITTYRLLVPWALLGSAPSAAQSIGLAATIAHKDRNGRDALWGSAQALHRIGLDAPPAGPPAVAVPGRPLLLAPTSARFAARLDAPATLVAEFGSRRREMLLSATGWNRVDIAIGTEDLSPAGRALVLRLLRDGHEVFRTDQTYRNLDTLGADAAGRIARIRAALPTPAADPLAATAAWHLDNLAAFLAQERALRPLTTDTASRAATASAYEGLLERFPDQPFDITACIRQGTPLVGAFISQADDTLQLYSLQLPFAWEPAKAYPLTVYLHGTGSPWLMENVALTWDNSHQDTLYEYRDIDPREVPPAHRGFLLAPWGRGNNRYAGIAARDIYLAMADVERRFTIDPDRRYLTGFSMGSGGAGTIAMYKPDLWAGVGFAAGFGGAMASSRTDLRENLRPLPLFLWCGMDDSFLPAGQALAEALALAGFRTETRFVPGLPHTLPYREFNRMLAWLHEHRRDPRPRRFSFRTDDPAFIGRNGVDMVLQPGPSGVQAEFLCRISGPTLAIDTLGCSGLRLDPRRLGLAEDVETIVVWNGKEAFRGRPDPRLPIVIGDRDGVRGARPFTVDLR
jgi:predicted esterase